MPIEQGVILKIEGLEGSYLVVSKDFFNQTEQAVLCPIVTDTFPDPLHLRINTKDVKGIVMCEQLKMLDLRYRGYSKVTQLKYADIMEIADAVQSIFDY